LRFGEKDNFWAMGDTGPCGPNSEIHIDRGAAHGCGKPDCQLGCECDRFLEIWNLVFMQFNRDADGRMTPLPKPSIDTGMGLERIVSILQNTPSNYETDLLLPIIRKVEEMTAKRLGASAEADVAMKVIADHSRATAFLIGDGVLPSNEGRGYVLRRIMRRAIRYGRNIGLLKPFLHETAGVVFDIMKNAYPELGEARAFITNVIENEELRFSETLDHGLKLLNDTLSELRAKGLESVPGAVIFKLYDTFGFPVDIVRDVVRDRGMTLDMPGFEREMAKQREKSRSVATFTQISEAYRGLSAQGVSPRFVGYDNLSGEAQVLLIVRDGAEVESARAGETVEVVTSETPFYGESGGQVGDQGEISAPQLTMTVSTTVKDPTGMIIHKGQIAAGTLRKGDAVTLTVNGEKRRATACNHTATHILHAVLRQVLGDHIRQAGSLVAPDRLRFDFTHFSQVAPADLDRIETLVNDRIRENLPAETAEMAAEEALQSGATALFEEKYGDRVRVVSLADFSQELCGGTHTERTGDIGVFKIVMETSVAAGVRRIEAMTGAAALAHLQQQAHIVQNAARLLKDKPEGLAQRIEGLLSNQKALEREVERLSGQLASASASDAEKAVRTINGVKVLASRVNADSPGALRELADRFKEKLQSGVVVLGAASGPKALLIAAVTQDLTGRFHAGNIVKAVAALVGGGGGGRPDMAQAGGTQPENLDAALEKVALKLVANIALVISQRLRVRSQEVRMLADN
jgi:alanyl-tRNA synthetase